VLNLLKKGVKTPEKIRPFLRYKKQKGLSRYYAIRYGTIAKWLHPPYNKPISNYSLFTDQDIYVFTDDPGISRDIAAMGIREPFTTRAYIEELSSISKVVDELNILEFGANIGYYALIGAEYLEDGKMIAVEVDPDNTYLLRKNISKNNLNDVIEVEEVAVGPEEGEKMVFESDRSNRHTLEEIGEDESVGKYKTKVTTPKMLLEKHGISDDEVNVIRMDMEGYETEILPELKDILNSTGPLLVNIELHPKGVGSARIKEAVEILERSGLEIVSTARFSPAENREIDVDSFEDLKEYSFIEVVAKKGY
jgi:FkbM family methyltransferase